MKFRLNCEYLEQRENPADLFYVNPLTGAIEPSPFGPPIQTGPTLPDITWYPPDFVGPMGPNDRYLPPPPPPAPPAPPGLAPAFTPAPDVRIG